MNWTCDVEQALSNSLTCSLSIYDKDQDHVDELMLVMVILRKLPTSYEYETRQSPFFMMITLGRGSQKENGIFS